MSALCQGDKGIAGTAQFLSCLLKILANCELSVKILSYGGDLQTALNTIDEVSVPILISFFFTHMLQIRFSYSVYRVTDFWNVSIMTFHLWIR